MIEKYTFGEALAWITDNELKVSLTLNGKTRVYYQDKDGYIICIPNGKKHLAYVVKDFKVDAILSKEWVLLDENDEVYTFK